jgi:hypothetical protein
MIITISIIFFGKYFLYIQKNIYQELNKKLYKKNISSLRPTYSRCRVLLSSGAFGQHGKLLQDWFIGSGRVAEQGGI